MNTQKQNAKDEHNKIVHELKVHQLELEIQNDELKRIQAELTESKARYFELYEQAPVGYFTVDKVNTILEINLTAANMLSKTKEELLKTRITKYIFPEDQDIFYLHKKNFFETSSPQICELRMVKNDVPFWARLEAKPAYAFDNIPRYTAAISDISSSKLLEQTLVETNKQLEIKIKELQQAKLIAEEQAKVKDNFLTNMSHEIRTPLNGIIGLVQLMNFTKMNKKQKHYIYTIDKESYILLSLLNNILSYSKLKYSVQICNNTKFKIRDTLQDIRAFFMTGINISVDIFFQVEECVPEIILCDEMKLKGILINLIGNAIKFTENGCIILKVYETQSGIDERLCFSIEDTGIGIAEKFISHLFENFVQADESISRRYGGTGLGLAISKETIELMGGKIVVKSRENRGTLFFFDIKSEIIEAHTKREYDIEVIIINKNKKSSKIFIEMIQDFDAANYYYADNLEEGLELIKSLSTTADTKFVTFIFENMFDDKSEERHLQLFEKYRQNIVLVKRIENQNNILFHSVDLPVDQEEIISILKSIENGIKIEDKFENDLDEITLSDNNLRIMVIEDNRTNLEVLKQMFKIINCKADYFKDGLSAIKKIKTKKYDIVFTDIQLPDFSGFDILSLIREVDTEKSIHTIVVAITAHVLDDYEERCLEAGMDEYISKPIILGKLCEIIDKYSKNPELIKKKLDTKLKDLEIIKKIEHIAFEDCKKSLDKIGISLKNRNYEEIKKEAHKLKGSFSSIRRKDIENMSVEMGLAANDRDNEKIIELIYEINKEVIEYEITGN